MTREVLIHSDLPAHQVVERIGNLIQNDAILPSPVDQQRPLRGWVRGESFKLRLATGYGHSMAPVLEGRIVAAGHGTDIVAHTRLSAVTTILLPLIVIASIGALLISHWVPNEQLAEFGLAGLVIGIGVACIGGIVAVAELQTLRAHLLKTLEQGTVV